MPQLFLLLCDITRMMLAGVVIPLRMLNVGVFHTYVILKTL